MFPYGNIVEHSWMEDTTIVMRIERQDQSGSKLRRLWRKILHRIVAPLVIDSLRDSKTITATFGTSTPAGSFYSYPCNSHMSPMTVQRSYTLLSPADKLLSHVAGNLDKKDVTDADFRDWLRDNLSACEYVPMQGQERYRRPTRPAYLDSLLDSVLQSSEQDDEADWSER